MSPTTQRALVTAGWALVLATCGACGWVLNEALDDKPFFNTTLTCGPDEVAVWNDYPDTYDCVNADDHAHHQGG